MLSLLVLASVMCNFAVLRLESMTSSDSTLYSLAMFQKLQNSEDAGRFFQVWSPHKLLHNLAGITVRGHSAFELRASDYWNFGVYFKPRQPEQWQRLNTCVFPTPQRSPGKGGHSNESNSCLSEGAAWVHFAFSCSLAFQVSSQVRNAQDALLSSNPDIEIHLWPSLETN